MTLDFDVPVFPNNVVTAIRNRFITLDPDLFVTTRPLRPSDPNQSVGVFGTLWAPEEGSTETGKLSGLVAISEPTISRYTISVQGFVKNGDEEQGLMDHSVLAKTLRAMLYRDATLHVSLRSLSVEMFGSIERTQRYGIVTQRYVSNEVSGAWLYLSTLEMFFETETV